MCVKVLKGTYDCPQLYNGKQLSIQNHNTLNKFQVVVAKAVELFLLFGPS